MNPSHSNLSLPLLMKQVVEQEIVGDVSSEPISISEAEARTELTEPLRVAHVLHSEVVGGVEVATLRLAKALEEGSDISIVAFCNGEHSSVEQLFFRNYIKVVPYEAGEFSYRHPTSFLRSTRQFARELRRYKIDLVHCSDLMSAYHAGPAAKLVGVPVVCHIRSGFPNFQARYKPPIFTVDRFVFVSHATWRNFNKIFPLARKRGVVIYDWPPESDANQAVARWRVREQFEMDAHSPLLGMIARIAPQKDFETLIEAMSKVVATNPDVRLLLIGDNQNDADSRAYYEKLVQEISALGITDNVIWGGFREDTADLLSAMDVVLLCTHSEGLPLIILEAMSLGRPVVATDAGGVSELIQNGETGLLHKHQDADHLAMQIQVLLNSPELAKKIGNKAQKVVQARFTRESAVNSIRDLYFQLAKKKRKLQTA